jgi:hypothetical protein
MNHLYQHIHGQPFLRIYGQFAKSCRDRMRDAVATTTIVPGPLHKLIPINIKKGVYMIAYTDNADALRVERALATTDQPHVVLCRMLERALNLPADSLQLDKIRVIPWTIGTHFYAKGGIASDPSISGKLSGGPFATRRAFVKAAQRPYPNVAVVGEMVSLNHQGWVEGCLESVDRIFY